MIIGGLKINLQILIYRNNLDSDKPQFGPWDIHCREAMLYFKTRSNKKEYVDFILLQNKLNEMEQNDRKCDNKIGINYANEI